MSGVRKNLIKKLKEENIEAKFIEVEKNNRIIRGGLSVRRPEQVLATTVYFEEKESDEDLYERVMELIDMEKPEIDTSMLMDYTKASKNFVLKVSTKPASDLVKMHAFCDMYMTIAIRMGEGMSARVTPDMLKRWGVTITRAFNDAIENSAVNAPAEYRRLNDIVEEMTPGLGNEDCKMMVLSNTEKLFGASALIYSDVVEKLDEKGQNFVLLPSSVHEVLIMPENEFKASEMSELTRMVQTINDTVVNPEEVLAEHAYAYRDGVWYIIDEEGNLVR